MAALIPANLVWMVVLHNLLRSTVASGICFCLDLFPFLGYWSSTETLTTAIMLII